MTHLLPPTHLLTWVGNLTKVKNREKLWLISICVHHENKRKPKSRDYSLDFFIWDPFWCDKYINTYLSFWTFVLVWNYLVIFISIPFGNVWVTKSNCKSSTRNGQVYLIGITSEIFITIRCINSSFIHGKIEIAFLWGVVVKKEEIGLVQSHCVLTVTWVYRYR
jgi:hypothetical protein